MINFNFYTATTYTIKIVKMIESVSTKEFGAFTKENIVVDSNSLEEEVYTTKKTNWKLFKDGFKSKEGFKSFIFLDSSTSFANKDLLPVPSEKKNMGMVQLFCLLVK